MPSQASKEIVRTNFSNKAELIYGQCHCYERIYRTPVHKSTLDFSYHSCEYTKKMSPHQNFDPSIGTIILTDDNRSPSACRIYSTCFLLRLPFQMLSQVSPSLTSSQNTNKHEILHTTCTRRTCPVLCMLE